MEENANKKVEEIKEKVIKNKKKIIIGGVVVTGVVVLTILVKKFGPGILDKLAAGSEVAGDIAAAAEPMAIEVGGEAVTEAIVDAAA